MIRSVRQYKKDPKDIMGLKDHKTGFVERANEFIEHTRILNHLLYLYIELNKYKMTDYLKWLEHTSF